MYPAVAPAASHRVLWIDDMVRPDDAVVTLLGYEGFEVSCALTGVDGLALARSAPCDAVILDLRLPDMHGLKVLEGIREYTSSPVLVLTAYMDFESPLAALKLGAAACLSKPIDAEELGATLRTLIGDALCRVTEGDLKPPPGESSTVSRTLSHLDAITARGDAARSEQEVVACLSSALGAPTLPVDAFLGCAEALRRVIACRRGAGMPLLAASAVEAIRTAMERCLTPRHPKVREAVSMLENNPHRWPAAEIARKTGVSRAHLGRLVHMDLGVGYRELRCTLLIKKAVRLLLTSDEQIAQIGFALGFTHPSQLDREFHQIFGCSPRELRQICRPPRRPAAAVLPSQRRSAPRGWIPHAV